MDNPVEISNNQLEYMWEVGRKHVRDFENNNIAFTDSVIMLTGTRKLLVWIYCLLRNYGKLTAIELLDQDVKEKMWRFVKEVCKGKTEDIQKMKEIAMAFYTIEYFINENNT
jgi:hypothetical protein